MKEIELFLESNPSTGYSWIEVDGSWGIQEVQSYYVHTAPTETKEGEFLVGGGGKEHIKIWVSDLHNYHLELVYCHPWEVEDSIVDRVTVESVV